MGLFSFSDDREPDATRAPNSDPDKDETTINERGQVRRVEHDKDGTQVRKSTWW